MNKLKILFSILSILILYYICKEHILFKKLENKIKEKNNINSKIGIDNKTDEYGNIIIFENGKKYKIGYKDGKKYSELKEGLFIRDCDKEDDETFCNYKYDGNQVSYIILHEAHGEGIGAFY